MKDSPRFASACLAALLAAGPVLAEPPAPAEGPAAPAERDAVYPVAVSLRLAGQGLRERFWHQSMRAFAPTNPSTTVMVGEQAQGAYERALQRLFRPAAPGQADAELEVAVEETGYEGAAGRYLAFVVHRVVLRRPAGAEVARWSVRGEGAVDGLGEKDIHAAFAEAAENAARAFDRGLEEAPGFGTWLGERGLAVAERSRMAPVRPLPPPPAPPPPRRSRGFFLEVGVARTSPETTLEAPLWGGGATVERRPGTSLGGLLGAGWMGSHVFLRAQALKVQHVFEFQKGFGEVRAQVLSLGLDAGARLRLHPNVDVLGGGGLHRVDVSWDNAVVGRMVPSAVACLRYAVPTEFGMRLTLAAEVRVPAGPAIVDDRSWGRGRRFHPGTTAALILGAEVAGGGDR